MKKILFASILLSGLFSFSQSYSSCKTLVIKNYQNTTNQIVIEAWDQYKSQGYQQIYNFNIGPGQTKSVDVSMYNIGTDFKVWASCYGGQWCGLSDSYTKCTYSIR